MSYLVIPAIFAYFQVDLGDVRKLYAIFTTGRNDLHSYVTKYKLTWSVDDSTFNEILRDDNSAIFDGPTESSVQVKQYFLSPIEAQYVRLTVVECEGTDDELAVNWGLLGNPGKICLKVLFKDNDFCIIALHLLIRLQNALLKPFSASSMMLLLLWVILWTARMVRILNWTEKLDGEQVSLDL